MPPGACCDDGTRNCAPPVTHPAATQSGSVSPDPVGDARSVRPPGHRAGRRCGRHRHHRRHHPRDGARPDGRAAQGRAYREERTGPGVPGRREGERPQAGPPAGSAPPSDRPRPDPNPSGAGFRSHRSDQGRSEDACLPATGGPQQAGAVRPRSAEFVEVSPMRRCKPVRIREIERNPAIDRKRSAKSLDVHEGFSKVSGKD